MSKKRKHDQLQDQNDTKITKSPSAENATVPASKITAKSKGQLRQEKSERRAKKQKKAKEQDPEEEEEEEEEEEDQHNGNAAVGSTSSPPVAAEASTPESKLKAQKNEKKKKKTKHQDEASENSALTEASEPKPEMKAQKKEQKKEKKKKSKPQDEAGDMKSTPARFIVFVGNLPYDATVEQIKAHFSKISPTSVRQSSNKATGKGKGFAFLEFDNYDKMKTCLKLYHHSIFDAEGREKGKDTHGEEDDTGTGSKRSTGRRINVELTAGGGGKSKDRKAKIKYKNQKLEEERERRRLNEKTEREKAGTKQKAPVETGANATEVKDLRGDIHPSRLSRVSH